MKKRNFTRYLAFPVFFFIAALALVASTWAARPLEPTRKFKPLPVDVDHIRGLTYDGTYLFVSARQNGNPMIFMVDPASETVVDKFLWTLSPSPDHLAWDGQYYYVADSAEEMIFVINTAFEFQRKFAFPDSGAKGMCFDDNGRLLVVSQTTKQIYAMDPATGATQGIIPIPVPTPESTDTGPGDLLPSALAFDGQNLWHTMVNENGTSLLYQMDLMGNMQQQFDLSYYVTSLAFDYIFDEFLWGAAFSEGVFLEFEPFAPLPPFADIWAVPNPVYLGGPVDLHCTFYNTDPIIPEPFLGALVLGIMFEYQWVFYPIYAFPVFLPRESTIEDVILLSIPSYPYMPSHYFGIVLVNTDLQLVSYDIEDMDDADVGTLWPKGMVKAKVEEGLKGFLEGLTFQSK